MDCFAFTRNDGSDIWFLINQTVETSDAPR
jgi:hypothetical protein